ncbi:DDE-type integrase/transposase/recombinase [Clostridium perfringens]|nr:DDE-type integrase/transposase/recombinase [Clostridium perfringens]MDM0537753.1 DDE-type integrase/transposase/recombinase [Clostridium perfringens]
MILKENSIIERDKEVYRVLDINVKNEDVIIISLNKNKWPETINYDYLIKLIDNGVVRVTESFNEKLNVVLSNDEKYIEKMNFAYEIVRFLEEKSSEKEIYYKNYRGALIDEAIKIYGVSYSTIRKYLIRYWKGAKCKYALIPQTYKCGGKGKEKNILNKKEGVIINEKVKSFFKKSINKYYNNSKKITIKDAYELMIRDYIKEVGEDLPTIKQFYYWFNKLNSNKKLEISSRFGERIYNQKTRPILGSSFQDAELGPATLYQVDSTILDVYIVSKHNRNLIVGRPVLYIVIDVYSRMIVGINLTLEPFNSYTGVMGALINAFIDKTNYCKSFGIDIKEDEWNVKCLPQKILADRGELLSEKVENAISKLGILIQNTPPYRGDYKGIVEKSFQRIHSYLKPFVDGYVDNGVNKVERGAEDYRLKANLTLEELTTMIIRCVLFHNNHHVLDYYEGDELTINKEISKKPINLWNEGIKSKKGLLRELNEDVIKITLMPTLEAIVTAKGIKFENMYYTSPGTIENGWYQKARVAGTYKIKVSYNTNNVNHIYFIDENLNIEILELVSYMEKYKGLSLKEVKELNEYEAKLNKLDKEIELKEKIKLFDSLDEITKNAKEIFEKEVDVNIPKSHRLKNIKENLNNERIINRKKANDAGDELDLFLNAQEEGWDDYE